MEVAARRLIGIDMLVDALMAHAGLPLAFEPAGDLFGTPVLPQVGLNLKPDLPSDAGGGSTPLTLLARGGHRVRLLRAIATPSAITAQLARSLTYGL